MCWVQAAPVILKYTPRLSSHLLPHPLSPSLPPFLPTLNPPRTWKTKDAHEFFNFVLNEMADSLVARNKRIRQQQQEAAALDQKHRFNQSQSSNHQQSQQPSSTHQHQHQQQQHAPDPRRSSWTKLGIKTGFGNGSKNGPPPHPGTETTTSSVATDQGTEQRTVGREGGASTGGGQVAPESGEGLGSARHTQKGGDENSASSSTSPSDTWVHRIFQGVLTNQTKCLCCETVGIRHCRFLIPCKEGGVLRVVIVADWRCSFVRYFREYAATRGRSSTASAYLLPSTGCTAIFWPESGLNGVFSKSKI